MKKKNVIIIRNLFIFFSFKLKSKKIVHCATFSQARHVLTKNTKNKKRVSKKSKIKHNEALILFYIHKTHYYYHYIIMFASRRHHEFVILSPDRKKTREKDAGRNNGKIILKKTTQQPDEVNCIQVPY